MASPTGFEGSPKRTIQHDLGTIRDRVVSADVPDDASKCPTVREPGRIGTNAGDESGRIDGDDPLELAGVVETALASALTAAARAGQWELVGRLAAELEARRTARTVASGAGVADLGEARSKRKGEAG